MKKQTNILDSHNRVAVFVTDGNRFIVGKAPQSKGLPNGFDLPKGHVHYDESFIDAAKREVYEETGIVVDNLTQLSGRLPYRGDTLEFFVSFIDTMPLKSTLVCKSTFEWNGKAVPEFTKFEMPNLEQFSAYLYPTLVALISKQKIIDKVKEQYEQETNRTN